MKRLLFVIILSTLMGFESNSYAQEVKKVPSVDEIKIEKGSGSFLISGGYKQEAKIIEVHYYKPGDYQPDYAVILVIPGGGRNGDTYRDTWIELAEKYDLLVLSPSYSDGYYPRSVNYNLGRMIMGSNSFNVNNVKIRSDPKEWLFADFDRIFDIATKVVGSTEKKYDIFGHSAGGQIVHRLVMFYPEAKINRAIAANSGWYTMPDFSEKFPYGLKNSPITEIDFEKSLGVNLMILIGELDNENETRGQLRKSREAMKQGAHRLARGNFFYETALKESNRLGFDISWKRQIIEGVGHSYREMGAAAAKYLYGSEH